MFERACAVSQCSSSSRSVNGYGELLRQPDWMLLKGYPERNYLLTKDPTTLMPFGLKTIIFNGFSYIVQTKMPENADENGGFPKRLWKWSVLKSFPLVVWKGENGCFKNAKVWPEAELPWRPSLVWVQLKLYFSKHNSGSSTPRPTSDLLNLTIKQTQVKMLHFTVIKLTLGNLWELF